MRRGLLISGACLIVALLTTSFSFGQAITASLQGRVADKSGAVLPKATVTVTNTETGFSRSTVADDTGQYKITSLPVGDYKVTAQASSFQPQSRVLTLSVGDLVTLDFSLSPGAVEQQVTVTSESPLVEPTRTSTDSVIEQQKIQNLPVNGRQFIDFALLAPGVTVGDTTSGSTDVIIEPVTKLSFAGQNIHYNFIAIDGADNTSTASGVQKTTPSTDAVREFRVINNTYSVQAGRAVGGIVNIITKSGTNDVHGSVYEYFRNDAMDANSELAAPGLNKLQQNQFGFTIGGPIRKGKTFYFGNYEGQRRNENPFYNSIILNNLTQINQFKANFGLPAEQLNVNRESDYDNFIVKLDHSFNDRQYAFLRYFFNDGRLTNVSPLNDGFDLPSGFKENNLRDQSLAGSLSSTFTPNLVNEARYQFGHRTFDFPTVTTQPHLEVLNTFTAGVNRGNPDFYQESRNEIVDNVTWQHGKHTISFGGDFSHVNTLESFPLFYPFEADFGCLFAAQCPFSLEAGAPSVLFFERFQAPNFTEPTFDPAVLQGQRISDAVRHQAEGDIGHNYGGLYVQDAWRPTSNFSMNYGLRYQFETFPSNVLNNPDKQFDPRAGFSYHLGTRYNIVIRGGAGIFHGIIPMPLLACQKPSCGGTTGKFPGRPDENDLNATTRLFAFASAPNITQIALASMLGGTYPDAAPLGFCPGGTVAGCGFFGDAVIARFDQNHKAPYGIQTSFGIALQPTDDSVLDISFLRSKGVHLGSFFNVNQPDPSGQETVHNSQGQTGVKNTFFAAPGVPGARSAAPGFPTLYAVYFEAASRWNSEWNGLLVDYNKRMSHHFSGGFSYTWSKGIDDGPNPSFVLIPQDSNNLKAERAISSDSVGQRFVLNATIDGPTNINRILNNFHLSTIVSLQSPNYFTKFAGFDANGDIFGNNDRVGIEPRNTFKGDSYQSVDVRLARTFKATEKMSVETTAEAFNVLNTVNVRFFNTVYGAADFCNFNPTAQGCSATQSFLEGSPNPTYGTPRAVFNPRQIQLALRLNF
ncbi:MAG TPA: carboxypeptidase regulatory-like domain-containing protein [Candidatus Acidoferrales bacterium]|nr:carboxypeptidase regulatory-like domain-containing protein [Candidatus Acidoferrales bacterium]